MKSLIKLLLKKKLNEVNFEPHFYERSEDRLWGKKPQGPASINASAWDGNYADTVDLKAYDETDKSLYIKKHIPITQTVKIILDKINLLNNIDFKTNKGVAIVMWKSSVTYTGKDQNPPGQQLLVIIRNNSAINMQWQPSVDVNISGGKVTGIDYIINIDTLIEYIKANNKTVITTEDLEAIKNAKSKTPKPQPKVVEKPTIIVNGSKYVVYNDNGDLVNKNNPQKIIKFDELSDDLQMQILDLLK